MAEIVQTTARGKQAQIRNPWVVLSDSPWRTYATS